MNDIHRWEILVTDSVGHLILLAVVMAMLALTVTGQLTQNRRVYAWVPFLGYAFFGAVIRMDTMIHRKGAWLKSIGDVWELAKAGHAPTRYLMPWGDAMIVVFVLVMWVFAIHVAKCEFQQRSWWPWYNFVAWLGIPLGVAGWLTAMAKAGTGFAAK